MSSDLTTRQKEILDFIRWHIGDYGYPPTVRDLCRAFDISSPNGITCHLKALEKKGYIERERNLARGLVLTEASQERGIPFVKWIDKTGMYDSLGDKI